jgi:lipopolysaccharide/colanic/teichoic acid biosynthesis glycosyltransferase
MSLVGPRPEVPALVDPGDPRWSSVLRARPGLTDPVTLRLRDEETLIAAAGEGGAFYRDHLQPFKLRGYERYLAERSWKTDMRILKDTLRAVISPKSVSPPSVREILAEGLQCESRG